MLVFPRISCMKWPVPHMHTGGGRMIPRITAVLTRLKTDWAAQLEPDAIMAVCREAGYTSWRDRVLTPVTTIQLFLLQILHGNTACSHLPHLSGLRFSASAYCQARSKLPLGLFGLLLTRFCTSAQSRISDEGLGYRAWNILSHRRETYDGHATARRPQRLSARRCRSAPGGGQRSAMGA